MKILKRIAQGIIPDRIVQRKKQPYRAPDAVCFLRPAIAEYVEELLSEKALIEAGVFDPKPVRNFLAKCHQRYENDGSDALFSNIDNMGFVGILSTQLLYDQFIRNNRTHESRPMRFTTLIDRVQSNQVNSLSETWSRH